jgi:enolase
MDEKEGELDRLCKVYEKLDTGDKEKVIRLAEELLDSQKKLDEDKPVIHKQKGMSEQEINAFAILTAAIVNQKEINLHDLLEDFQYYKDIIRGDDDTEPST